MAADFKTVVVRGTTPTSTGTKSFTSSGFGTPKAALIFLSHCITAGSVRGATVFGIGACDGTNEWGVGISAMDGQNTTVTNRVHSTSKCVATPYNDAAYISAAFSAWTTDGVTLNFSAVSGTAREITVVLLAGSDLSVYAGSKSLTDTTTTDITDPGFEPDAVLVTNIGLSTAPETLGAAGILSFGCAVNDGSATNRMAALSSVDAVGTSVVNSIFRENACVGQIYNDTESWYGSIGTFDANGFTVTTNADPLDDYIFYLALGGIADAGGDIWLGTEDSPTSSGTWASTTPGFEPNLLVLGLSKESSVASLNTTTNAALGIAADDGTIASCVATSEADAQGTSNSCTISDSQLVNVYHSDQAGGSETQKHDIDASSFTATGWTSTVNGTPDTTARKWWALAVGVGAAGGTDVFFDNRIDEIAFGMRVNTAAKLGGVLIE